MRLPWGKNFDLPVSQFRFLRYIWALRCVEGVQGSGMDFCIGCKRQKSLFSYGFLDGFF